MATGRAFRNCPGFGFAVLRGEVRAFTWLRRREMPNQASAEDQKNRYLVLSGFASGSCWTYPASIWRQRSLMDKPLEEDLRLQLVKDADSSYSERRRLLGS